MLPPVWNQLTDLNTLGLHPDYTVTFAIVTRILLLGDDVKGDESGAP